MRIKEVRALVTQAIMDERERCARIADKAEMRVRELCNGYSNGLAEGISREIRSANPPIIRVVRPETIAADPSKLTPGAIVAGQALIDDQIVDRHRMQAKEQQC